jgi:hypothetical protein
MIEPTTVAARATTGALDGTVERTTDFVEVHTLSVAWFLAGRPHE